jgi:hypothetical protein
MPSGQIGDGLADRLFHIAAERQNIAAVAHGDGEPDGGLAVDAKHRLRRIGKGAAHFGDVAQPDQPSIGEKIDVENVVLRALAGTEIPVADSMSIRPVTVAPSRIALGGSLTLTLTLKVRVTGSACGST